MVPEEEIQNVNKTRAAVVSSYNTFVSFASAHRYPSSMVLMPLTSTSTERALSLICKYPTSAADDMTNSKQGNELHLYVRHCGKRHCYAFVDQPKSN